MQTTAHHSLPVSVEARRAVTGIRHGANSLPRSIGRVFMDYLEDMAYIYAHVHRRDARLHSGACAGRTMHTKCIYARVALAPSRVFRASISRIELKLAGAIQSQHAEFCV